MKPSYIYLLSNLETDLRLPGFNVDAGQSSALDYARYLGDESLRSAINSLVSRNAIQVLALLEANHDSQFNGGAYFLAEWFPILTEAELEAELLRCPIVLALGRALILAIEPSDDSLAAGQGALYITNDPNNGFAVWVKAKGTYAQLSPDDGDQGLIYTATQIGSSGNYIWVEHVLADPGVAENVVVTVIEVEDTGGNKHTIHVVLPTSGEANPAALFLREDGVNSDLVLTARVPGAAGNDIIFAKEDIGDDEVDTTTVEVEEGVEILVTLAQSAAVAEVNSHVTSDSVADNSRLLFGINPSWISGTGGDNSAVKIVADDAAEAVSVTVQDGGPFTGGTTFLRITVPSVDGVPTAIAQDLIEAMTAFFEAHGPLYLAWTIQGAPGSDNTGLVDVWDSGPGPEGSYYTSGGVDGVAAHVTATAAQVKAAVEANSDANALVSITNGTDGDGSGQPAPNTSTALEGGQDAGVVIASPSDVAGIVNGDDVAAQFVSVDPSDGTLAALELTALTGGSDTAINSSRIEIDD